MFFPMTIFLFFGLILTLLAFIFIFPIPISIANSKNLTHNEKTTIEILTWCGLFVGVTWFIALFLAITYDDNRTAY